MPTDENRAQDFLDWVESLKSAFIGVRVEASMAAELAESTDRPAVDVLLLGKDKKQVEVTAALLKARAKLKHGQITEDSGVTDVPAFSCTLQFEFEKPKEKPELPLAL